MIGTKSDWKPLTKGTRVKHLREGYEGWILGLTSTVDPARVNPDDRTQYRIKVHGQSGCKLAPENELCALSDADISTVFKDHATLVQKEIEGREVLPYPYKIYSLGYYHPEYGKDRRIHLDRGEHTFSILAVKNGISSNNDQCYLEKSEYIYRKLEPLLAHGFPISIVPSCVPDTPLDGLVCLIRKLANDDRRDATSCLVRHTRIIPSEIARKCGQDRNDIHRHLNSIKVMNESLFRSSVVLLLDDITTTGTSLLACRNLLLDKGASEVICLALGETRRLG